MMDTKKIMAALVVLMMAATSICVIPLDTSDADDDIATDILGSALTSQPGLEDLKVGQTVGFKSSESYSLSGILEKLGPALNTVISALAESLGCTPSDIVELVRSLGADKAADLLQKVIDNPSSVKITKQELMDAINEVSSEMFTVDDVDMTASFSILGGTQKVAEKEYKNITVVEGKISITLDINSSNTEVIPNIYLKDAVLSIRAIEDTTVKFDKLYAGTSTNTEFDLSFSGTSNFINDSAETIDKMFSFGSEKKAFNIPLNLKANASVEIFADAGTVLPTVDEQSINSNINVKAAAGAEIATTNKAIKALIGDAGSLKWSGDDSFPCTITYYKDGNCYYVEFNIDYQGTVEGSGKIASGDEIFALIFDYREYHFGIDINPKTMYLEMYLKIDDTEEENALGDISASSVTFSSFTLQFDAKTFIVSVNGQSIDLSEALKSIQSMDLRYGADYILTTDEVKSLDKDLSKTAYALNHDVIGFNGENLNQEIKEDTKWADWNLRILIVIIVVLIIVIIALAISKSRQH